MKTKMTTNTNKTLEFNVVLKQLSSCAFSEKAQAKLEQLNPFLSESECKLKMSETTDAKKILEIIGSPPLASMKELDKTLDLAVKGSMLIPDQLSSVLSFVNSCRRMKSYLKRAEILDVELAFYGRAFHDLSMLAEEIDRSIRNGMVDDGASPALRDIRRRIENANTSVKAKLESILRGNKMWFADGYVATRNGRFVLPVKKEYKNKVTGIVIDTSGTGGTCFIEPTSVRKLQEELSNLQIDEDNEIRKILYTLTSLVDESVNELHINMDCMESLDFVFAKAKLSAQMKAIPVPITIDRKIIINQGRHPLLQQDTCVPLDFEIGGTTQGVVITGPNTGGKTVALKTVGLLSLMAQSGLHVPVQEGSTFCMNSNVLSDIGDGQSITENLSTFSSHITNIISILENVTSESLVLLDELGSGTDPAEGMGLAVSILAELRSRGCLFVATTHYPEIKDFAMNTDGLINARMGFDRESLRPLYKLELHEAGESCALYIARRLGFPEHMLKRAHTEAYKTHTPKNSDSSAIHDMVFEDVDVPVQTATATASLIKKQGPLKKPQLRSETFQIGDSVTIYPSKELGIIFKKSNQMGELGVQTKGKKILINHKRIKLLTPASELYPDDYDFSIIFDSVATRKAHHNMDKKHMPNLEITCEPENL